MAVHRTRQRGGTTAEWLAADTVLAVGEIGFETNSTRFKVGDGVTSWNNLDYATLGDTNVDARNHGVVGDGIVDDTTALNAVLAIGGVIRLPAGTYRVTDTLVGVSNTTLMGFGRAKIVLDTTSNVDVLRFRECTDVAIYGLEIDGKKSIKELTVSNGRGIHFNQVQRGIIADCYIHDTMEHGIRVGGGSDVYGLVDSADTEDIIVCGNTVKNCGNASLDRGWGIWCFWRVKDTLIHGNIVTDCYTGGIMVDDASSDATPEKECLRFTISNNIVRDSDEASAFSRGINVEGARDFSVTGNIVTGHNRGIVVNDGQGATDTGSGEISGNTVRNRHYGLLIVDCRDVTVSGNHVEIYSASSVAHGAIKVEQGTDGNACERIFITGNTIKSNGAGISTRMTVGYVPSGAGVNDITVAGNEITYTGTPGFSNQHVGIQIWDVARPLIRQNTVRGFYDGIYPDGDCVTPIVQDNIVENSTRYGIRVGAAGTVVRGNIFRGNGTSSLLFDSGARVATTVVGENISTDATFISGTTLGPTYIWPVQQSTAGQLEVVTPHYTTGQTTRLKLSKSWQPGTVAPTTGTYEVGDIVWNSAPSTGEFIGWVCTVSGTPGTWLGFGLIS